MGTWALTAFGLFSSAAAAAQAMQDLAPGSRAMRFLMLPLRAFCWIGILPAVAVGGYTGGMGMVAPLALHAARRRTRRSAKLKTVLGLVSSALVLAGGLIMRFAVTEAGKRSAADPHAYFEYTRSGR